MAENININYNEEKRKKIIYAVQEYHVLAESQNSSPGDKVLGAERLISKLDSILELDKKTFS